MKKKFLFTLLMAFMGIFVANATEVTINVDKANNVKVQGNNGSGEVYTLQNGANQFDIDPAQNPLLITPTEGAEIVSVKYNGNDCFPGGDGNYRVGIGSGPDTIDITTSGDGAGSETPVAKTTNFRISARGTDITGAPFKVYVMEDGDWVASEPQGGYYKVAENADMKITPDAAYEIESAKITGLDQTIEFTKEEDGSIVFKNTVPDYYAIELGMKLSENAIAFTIRTDYAGNVQAYLEWQREGIHDWEFLNLTGDNKFYTVADANPLEFLPVAGGEILQITRNGEVMSPIGWEGTGGYVVEVENGDVFTVSTRGPEIDMLVTAETGFEYNAQLSAYYFTKNDGSQIALNGTQDTLKGNQGEIIYVSPRPGTEYEMLMGSNGAQTAQDWKSWFRVVPGANGTSPAAVKLYGKRDVTGVVIDVDAASRVSVVQEGGRGEVLTLTDGKNQFTPADIKNALAVSSTEGNQITNVLLNGDPVAPNASGVYLVTVAESDYVLIQSRKSPVNMALSFELNEGANVNWLAMQINGQRVASVSPLAVKSYDNVTVAAAPGYVIESLECDQADVKVTIVEETGAYNLNISSADITEAKVTVALKEMEPAEGNAIVIPNGDPFLLKYSEMTYDEETDTYSSVKVLENNTVNEVKIGNYVQIYRIDGHTEYRYITVNGEAVSDLSSRSIKIKIEGRTEINAEVYAPTYTYTSATYDDVKHVVSGNLAFEIDGKQVTSFYAEPGMTVKIIALPETGYIFDHAEIFYPLTMAADGVAIQGDTYTFTEEDCENEFLLFKGVFNVDENQKTYVVRTSSAWLIDEQGNAVSALGTAVVRLADGTQSREFTGIEGETVNLEITVTNPEDFENYEVAGFCLMAGFPNKRISNPYTISAADADGEGVIWINGLIQPKGGFNAVGEIEADGFGYNAATATIYSAEGVKVYSLNGELLIDSKETETSVETLVSGVYVAVSNGKTIKFVKK